MIISPSHLRPVARLAFAVSLLSLLAASATAASLRPQDQFFAVNTRASGCTTDAAQLEASITVSQLVPVDEHGCQQWMPSHFDQLRQSPGADVLTVIYVHGNQVTHGEAIGRGLSVYRALTCQADQRPVRFILWSWPAAKVNGLINDFRVKANRTRPLGWQLAWGLDQLPPDSQISLIGYSYGARIIGGAMHLLAGGELGGGLTLAERVYPDRPAMRVAFLAPATHAQWYGEGQFHGLAMYQIDHLWTTVNPRDPAMRFYSWSSKQSDPQALGFRGPCCLDYDRRSRVTCCNVENSVGRSHDLHDYIGSSRRMASIWHHLSEPPAIMAPATDAVASRSARGDLSGG